MIYIHFQGGGRFFLIFSEHLPSDVVSGQAYFGNIAPVTLIKVNEFNMAGHIPGRSNLRFLCTDQINVFFVLNKEKAY